ncbi:hypothetical protein ACIQC8_06485 [Agrococcus sediminis]|uniref:hypothetical protein n=1 Tax=Agrococcus sediminis TaxID=2599924 RepID=UPI0037F4C91F
MRSAHHAPDTLDHHGHGCPRAADHGHHRHHGHHGHGGHEAAGQRRAEHVGPEPQSGRHPRGDARPRPTLERSILRSARRIRRAGLTPDQLHDRLAGAVSHADYITTMRTLRRIGAELR